MKMQCFGRWVLLFLLSGLSAFASGGEWISDSQGCKVFWAKAFTAGESITWSGTCRDGHAEGSGVLDFLKDGKLSERFEGTLEKGKVAVPWHARVGRGTLSWPNGDRYEGDIVDGRRTGKGVYLWADGSRYEGDFVDGKITGKGVHLWADGNRYEGDFVDYKPRGKGVMVLKEGHRYEGDFIDGRMSGKGVMVSKEGHRYEGDFIDYKMTGKGIWVTPRGGRYEGDFVNGIRNGKGVFVNSSGQRMEGHFVDGKFTKGIMTLSGGPDDGYVESMEGDFVDDRLTGEGIITSSGGQKRIGTFSNGSLVNGSWLRRDGSVVATYQNGRPSYSPDDDRGTSESGVVGPLLGVLQAAASARGRNAVVAQSPASTAGSAVQSGSGVCDPTPRGPDFAGNQRCCEKEGGVFDNQKTGWVCRKRGGKYGCAGPAWQCWAQ